jgi:PEGA domain
MTGKMDWSRVEKERRDLQARKEGLPSPSPVPVGKRKERSKKSKEAAKRRAQRWCPHCNHRVRDSRFHKHLERMHGIAIVKDRVGLMGRKAEQQPHPISKLSHDLLSVSSTPSRANIEVDGRLAGKTPCSVAVPKGEHAIRITKSGYQSWECKTKTHTGKTTVAAKLKREIRPGSQRQS